MDKQDRLMEIAKERSTLLAQICIAQTRVMELDRMRYNVVESGVEER